MPAYNGHHCRAYELAPRGTHGRFLYVTYHRGGKGKARTVPVACAGDGLCQRLPAAEYELATRSLTVSPKLLQRVLR